MTICLTQLEEGLTVIVSVFTSISGWTDSCPNPMISFSHYSWHSSNHLLTFVDVSQTDFSKHLHLVLTLRGNVQQVLGWWDVEDGGGKQRWFGLILKGEKTVKRGQDWAEYWEIFLSRTANLDFSVKFMVNTSLLCCSCHLDVTKHEAVTALDPLPHVIILWSISSKQYLPNKRWIVLHGFIKSFEKSAVDGLGSEQQRG